ncbi:MAG: DUF4011 domain-containing protein, partial [Holosporales bacterium]|nr:DUF4011 domain-containing protein [Holosporales bacterium]
MFSFIQQEDKVMICNVTFPKSSRSYAYISNDATLKANDKVVVPVGSNNAENIGTVVSTGFYTRSTAPYPVEKTKQIIRKATDIESQPIKQAIDETANVPQTEAVTEKPKNSPDNDGGTSSQLPAINTDNISFIDSEPIPKAAATSNNGHSNTPVLKRKVEHWGKQLLDLSKRNKMINYRETKRATLKILEPEFIELFNRLAVTEQELTFQRPIDKDSDLRTFSMLSLLETLSYPIPAHVGDIKAEGSLLERRIALNNLRSKSKLARDEQGTNILYLSFGFIEWKENNSANAQWLKSPVLMMPVSLKLESIQAPYTLLRYDDDIEVNPTLDYLFNERYGIDLPAFELNGEESIEQYMQAIEEITDQHGWKLTREVSLGLLSFLKISMYHDLNNNYDRMLKNPVIKAMTGDTNVANNIPHELKEFDFDRVSPNDCYQVVNSDSSQQEAILLSKAGVSFVMQGPPGTGKSQTITNIIAEALADGKTILFVSEKAAALQVVYKRLTEARLDDFCLALHSHKANKKGILDSIAANLKLPRKRMKDSVMFELTELFQNRQALNQYVEELHEEILPLEKTLYKVFGELSVLQKVPYIQFFVESISSVSATAYTTMLCHVDSYAKALKRLEIKLSENPWRGTVVKMVTQQFKEDLIHTTDGVTDALFVLDEVLTKAIASFGLNETCTWLGASRTIALLQAIENTPLFPMNWSKSEERISLLDKAKSGRREQQEYSEAHRVVRNFFNESVFSKDLTAWLDNVHQCVLTVKNITGQAQNTDSEVIAQTDNNVILAQSTITQLQTILSVFERANTLISFTNTNTLADANILSELLDLIVHCPAVNRNWFDASILQRAKNIIEAAREHISSLVELKKNLLESWEAAVLNINSDEMLLRFKIDYTSFFKVFKSAYRADVRTIRGVSKKIGAKFSDAEIIALLQQIGAINKENQWLSEKHQQLT